VQLSFVVLPQWAAFGALIATSSELRPGSTLLRGGGQERGARAGTENVAGIAGFGFGRPIGAAGRTDPDRHPQLAGRREFILQAIGTRITHMGPAGKGQVTKLLNQILVVVNMLAVSEALMFGKAAQLDLKKAVTAVESGAAGSWMLSKRAPQVLDNYWQPGFMIDLQQKDIDLVLEYAGELGVPLLATGMIRQFYARLQKEGKGRLGNHALIQALEPLMPASGSPDLKK